MLGYNAKWETVITNAFILQIGFDFSSRGRFTTAVLANDSSFTVSREMLY